MVVLTKIQAREYTEIVAFYDVTACLRIGKIN